MDPFTLGFLALSALSSGISIFNKLSAHDYRSRAIDLQSKQSTLRHQQELLSNYDILEQTLATNLAEASAKGIGLGSPSFEAVERSTINKIAKEERNLNLEESIYQEGLKVEKGNVKNTLYSSLFGDVASVGFNIGRAVKSNPSTR